MHSRNKKNLLKATALTLGALFMAGNALAGPYDTSVSIEKKINKDTKAAQKRVDRFAEQAVDLNAEYKSTLQLIDSLRIYNNQLELLIKSQEEEMASIKREMATIDATERGAIPLMNEMIASIDNFVQIDMPFKKEKRTERINKLKNYMIRADIPNSEKYRKILEAYQAEIGYGESISAYQDTIMDGSEEVQVEFLQVGRVALVYLTLDGKSAGFWNIEKKQYEELDDSYIRSIQQGIKMANKQATMNLIELPIPAAKRAE
ncbi:MAG: DUF3450 domain-containing protein [Enterobacterales bacterium]|nr:DUF3450 domain-containing protein [Enterobacterales bacterium]